MHGSRHYNLITIVHRPFTPVSKPAQMWELYLDCKLLWLCGHPNDSILSVLGYRVSHTRLIVLYTTFIGAWSSERCMSKDLASPQHFLHYVYSCSSLFLRSQPSTRRIHIVVGCTSRAIVIWVRDQVACWYWCAADSDSKFSLQREGQFEFLLLN